MAGRWLPASTVAGIGSLGAIAWRTGVEWEPPLQIVIGELQALVVVSLVLAWARPTGSGDAVSRRCRRGSRRLRPAHGWTSSTRSTTNDWPWPLTCTTTPTTAWSSSAPSSANADETLDSDPEACRAASTSALKAHDQAIEQPTTTVRLLRSSVNTTHAAPRLPTATLSALDQLVETAAAGCVALTIRSEEVSFSEATSVVAYRICQEALTDTLRHARGTQASLRIQPTPDSHIHSPTSTTGSGPVSSRGLRRPRDARPGPQHRRPRRPLRGPTGALIVEAWLPTGHDQPVAEVM